MLFSKLFKCEDTYAKDISDPKCLKNAYTRYINSCELQHLLPVSPSSEDDIIGIAESICRFGLLEPIRVFYDSKSGSYYIISGERRFAALTLLGRTRILCHIITDPETCDAIIIAEYCLSKNTDIFKAGAALEYLINKRGYSVRELSRKSGIPASRISKLLKLQLLTYEERRRLQAAHMSVQVCCEIAEIDDHETRIAVINHITNQTPSISKIIEESKSRHKSFAFSSGLIDNSVNKLKNLIESTGAVTKLDRRSTDSGITYTINVSK